MKSIMYCICLLWMMSCQNNSVNPEPADVATNRKYIKLQIDLQQGFAGKRVRLQINEDERFQAILSDVVPFAGPEASFMTYTCCYQSQLTVSWACLNQTACDAHTDQAELRIGDLEIYYVGIIVSDTSIVVKVQDKPFIYL